MTDIPPDPVIDEIRAARHRISAACDHDPKKLVDYYRRLQEKYRDRIIASPLSTVPPVSANDLPPPMNPAVPPSQA
jgi:hypothetical protein